MHHILMRYSKKLTSTIALLSMVAFLAGASQTVGQFSPLKGSGYGYGDDGCTANPPKQLAVRYSKNNSKITFRWSAVSFDNCSSKKPASYELEIKAAKDSKGANETVEVTGIKKKSYTMNVTDLSSNFAYKFHVRAVAKDGNKTAYSKYKLFRTAPRAPGLIKISSVNSSTVKASWRNVPRSKELQYYLVTLQKDKAVLASAKVKKGLRGRTAKITVSGLTANTKYTLTVQAVYSSKLKSSIQQRSFRTKS